MEHPTETKAVVKFRKDRRLSYKKQFLICLFSILAFIITAIGPASANPGQITFGTLPVIQALPIFVAQETGLFKAEGLEVEIVPFRTALDKDVAMTAGRIEGYFGDLFTPIILRANSMDVRIVARNFRTTGEDRLFAVLAGPKSEIKSAAGLSDIPIAVSTNTIIEYVTSSLLLKAGIPNDKITFMETKNIPIRFQMLLSGQVEAATLPEPLVTMAVKKGCRVLADDSRTELSSTVLVFSHKTIKRKPEDIRAFIIAVNNAVDLINSGFTGVRDIMVRNCNIPEPLREVFPIPQFPKSDLPAKKNVTEAVNWLYQRQVLKSKPGYKELVDPGFVE